MKFSKGFWLNKEGVNVSSPLEVHDVWVENARVTLFAPHKKVVNRGDILNGTLSTIQMSSPMNDVIRVQVTHFAGIKQRGPEFETYEQGAEDVDIQNDMEQVIYQSGSLKVVVNKEDYALNFYYKDRRITSSPKGALAYITDEKKDIYMREQLSLGVGEKVYGLGERFTSFVKNGQVVDMWNEDGGTCSEIAYKNVPFYLSNFGYGVFVNHPENVSYEVASEVVSRVQFSASGESLDYFIIGGQDLKAVLGNYTALTGKPAMPPAWSFGLWLTTSFTTDYDEKTINSFIEGMAERALPLHVFHFDCFWMKGYEWCNFEWDRALFEDPKAMITRLKEKGLKICVWINPYIAQKSKLFAEGTKKGFLLQKPNGDVWQTDLWQAGMGIVDFTNPAATEWYLSQLQKLLDMGVDCFKTDFGERIPTEVDYFDGSDPIKMHNYYTFLYNKAVFELLERNFGKGQAALFARSATAGCQKFPVHWGGDCSSNYESMAETLRGGLSLGLSGFGFWSHDISGFEQAGTPDLYKRWLAFGLLSSHSRLHGSSSYRVPWLFDEEAVDVLRFFTRLKCELMPYLFKSAYDTTRKGIPMLRAMVLEFTNDPACSDLDQQYMLGDCLLVAPIFNNEGRASYYLPKGSWTNYISGAVVQGGRWVEESHEYMSIPLMVRENTLLGVGANKEKPDYDYADGIVFHAFEIKGSVTARIINTKYKTDLMVTIRREGNKLFVQAVGTGKPWELILRNIHEVTSVNGACVEATALGVKLIPDSYVGEFVCEI